MRKEEQKRRKRREYEEEESKNQLTHRRDYQGEKKMEREENK